MFLVLASTPEAFAGKLAEGFRGLAFGTALDTPPETAPEAACVSNPEPGIRWSCSVEIGGVPLQAHYGTSYGRHYTTLLQGKLDYAQATTLLDVLKAGWGTPRPMDSWVQKPAVDDKQFWMDGDIMAMWDRNQFSGETTLAVMSMTEVRQKEAADKAAAAAAVGGL